MTVEDKGNPMREAPQRCHGEANFLEVHRLPRLHRDENIAGFAESASDNFLVQISHGWAFRPT